MKAVAFIVQYVIIDEKGLGRTTKCCQAYRGTGYYALTIVTSKISMSAVKASALLVCLHDSRSLEYLLPKNLA